MGAGIATWWTLVDVGFTGGNRCGIGFATRVAALTALRLWQDGIDTRHQWVTINFK
jgi:hypothetical protein